MPRLKSMKKKKDQQEVKKEGPKYPKIKISE